MRMRWRFLLIVVVIVTIILIGEALYGEHIPLAPVVIKTHTHMGNVIQVTTAETFRLATFAGFYTVRMRGVKCGGPHRTRFERLAFEMAKNKLEKVNVLLECDGECRVNKQKQRLHYVRLPDIQDFGLNLVRMGLCETTTGKQGHPREEEYLQAQGEAQKAKRGIWKEP